MFTAAQSVSHSANADVAWFEQLPVGWRVRRLKLATRTQAVEWAGKICDRMSPLTTVPALRQECIFGKVGWIGLHRIT